MFHFIRGKVYSFIDGGIVLENNGIGYEIKVPELSFEYISRHKDDILIYTAMIVREDDLRLVGFVKHEDLELFNMLLKVNGVGPKAGLAILSTFSTNELKKIIIMEDDTSIAKAQGIGKKTAQRIILELKDKLGEVGDILASEVEVVIPSVKKEAIEALTSLGYSKSEATDAVNKVKDNAETIEELIKKSLISLSRQ